MKHVAVCYVDAVTGLPETRYPAYNGKRLPGELQAYGYRRVRGEPVVTYAKGSIPADHSAVIEVMEEDEWQAAIDKAAQDRRKAQVPSSVTKRQARQQLVLSGLLDQVQPAIDGIEDPVERQLVQIFWDDSQQYERDHPQLLMLAHEALGLTDGELDELFIAAGEL